jgi:ABC-type multidrug transport system ATPase subunit
MADRYDGAAVTADALSLRGPRGWVYREVGFTAEPGALVALAGPAGSGRTALLLTLAGRMRPTAGTAAVAGLALPAQAAKVRRIAALGPVPGVNPPDEALSVATHLRERHLLHARPFAPRARRRNEARTAHALATAGLALDDLSTPVRELTALDRFRLGTALALLGEPRLVCADDVGERLAEDDRFAAWAMLRDLADAGVTVLATTTGGPGTGHADLTLQLDAAPAEETADARA